MDIDFQGEFGDVPGELAIQIIFNGNIAVGYFA